ncbi:hypothetical protein N0V84_011310 [Fusarium piperis]|uniref:Uncharacterized protein n=1 Tax=Fusarium piperis TaxID=1435070 RepID=A0A9W8TDP1_9HYPO|nr:hypothetical protein N0V84_011310 [Fusarium piperis]
MSESTKRQRQASDAPARPQKRRRDKEPEPENGSGSERGHSSSPVPTTKVAGRPVKNSSFPLSKGRLKKTRAFFEKHRPPVREEDLDEMIGPAAPPLSDTWTQQDEDAMMAEWDDSPETAVYASITTLNGAIPTLWKVCLRVFRCSPLDAISPLRGLRYQPLVGRSQPGLWSREFCNRLSALITHPLWKGSPKRLAMALQYAVICRTDDRRHWSPDPLCSALANLRRSIKQHKGLELSQSVHKMHKKARTLATRDGDEPSTMSDLFLHIHRTVQGRTFDKVPEPVTSYKGLQVYAVNVHDLKVVGASIDGNFPYAVDEAYQVFRAAKGSGLEIPKANQLREFYERASRDHLRQIMEVLRDLEEGEDEEMGEPEPESESESESDPDPDPDPESSGSEPEVQDELGPARVPGGEPESESSEFDDEPSGTNAVEGLILNSDSEVDDAPTPVTPAPLPVLPRHHLPIPPSPVATAPLVPMTSPASYDMQDVTKVVNDLLRKERDEMRSFLESFREGVRLEMRSSLESFLQGVRLEMAEVQKRQDQLQRRQDRQNAEIKAFREEVGDIKSALEEVRPRGRRQQPFQSSDYLNDGLRPLPRSQGPEEQLGEAPNGGFGELMAASAPVHSSMEDDFTDLGLAPEGWENPLQPRPKATAEYQFIPRTRGVRDPDVTQTKRYQGKGLARIEAEQEQGL